MKYGDTMTKVGKGKTSVSERACIHRDVKCRVLARLFSPWMLVNKFQITLKS